MAGAAQARPGRGRCGRLARAEQVRQGRPLATTSATDVIYQSPLWDHLQFRVRSQDEAGNWGNWAMSPVATYIRRDDRQFKLSSGDWTRLTQAGAMHGKVAGSSTVGATATLKLKGTGVALVMPANSAEGSFRACLDPGTASEDCRTVDLSTFTPTGARRLVLAFVDLPRAKHKLTITVLSGTIDLDGAIFSR